jgi:mono/diheme cytochrome c family protein
VVLVIGLPLYWVFEPSRQAGAVEAKNEEFVRWGSKLFATTAEGGFNCAGCHGAQGGGGQAAYTITDPNTGQVKAVQWNAPALNTVFYRYDESEVKFILVYGRPFSPMSPWGLAGGGPMNDQQIETLIAKLKTLQIPREGCLPSEKDPQTCPTGTLPQKEQDKISEAATAAAQKLVDAGKYAQCRRRWVRHSSASTTPTAPTRALGVIPRAGATGSRRPPAVERSDGTSPADPRCASSLINRT